ncbi:uncharacterized protein LOC143282658 isoform X2 [Babylonia areolata]|uniref:uncharacterized protein LOC143282658 isoform X2 n=1 Tax=Babylonia areolata TaxID=304850 RepID=UPI003FD4A9DD
MTGVTGFLREREYGHRDQSSKHRLQKQAMQDWLDSLAATPVFNQPCEFSGEPKATFLVEFNRERTKIASTHGDHTVRVTVVATGKCTHILTGHPRTPWCIAFHPSHNDILASGCLGGQVRIWDLRGGGSEVYMANTLIASLTFHPVDNLLVFATKNKVFFWDWTYSKPTISCAAKREFETVRWVKFDTYGHYLYTGTCNGTDMSRNYDYRRRLAREEAMREHARRGGSTRLRLLQPRYTHNFPPYRGGDVNRGRLGSRWRERNERRVTNQLRYMRLLGILGMNQPFLPNNDSGRQEPEPEHPTSPVHEDRLRQAMDYARYVTSHSRDSASWAMLSARRARQGGGTGGDTGSEQVSPPSPEDPDSPPPLNPYLPRRPRLVANSPPPQPPGDSDDSDDDDDGGRHPWSRPLQQLPREVGLPEVDAAVGHERTSAANGAGDSQSDGPLRRNSPPFPPYRMPAPASGGGGCSTCDEATRENLYFSNFTVQCSACGRIIQEDSTTRTLRAGRAAPPSGGSGPGSQQEGGLGSAHSGIGASSASIPVTLPSFARLLPAGGNSDRSPDGNNTPSSTSSEQRRGAAATNSGQTACPEPASTSQIVCPSPGSLASSAGGSGSSSVVMNNSVLSLRSLHSSSVSTSSALPSAFQSVARSVPQSDGGSAGVSREGDISSFPCAAQTRVPRRELFSRSLFPIRRRPSVSGEASAAGDSVSAVTDSSSVIRSSGPNLDMTPIPSVSFPLESGSSGATSCKHASSGSSGGKRSYSAAFGSAHPVPSTSQTVPQLSSSSGSAAAVSSPAVSSPAVSSSSEGDGEARARAGAVPEETVMLGPSGSIYHTPTRSTPSPSGSDGHAPTPSIPGPSGSVYHTPTPSTLRPSRSVGDTPTPSTLRPSRSVGDTPTPSTLRPSRSVGDTPTPSTLRPSRSVGDTPTPSTLRPSRSVGDTPTPSTLRPSRSVGDTPTPSTLRPSGSVGDTPTPSTLRPSGSVGDTPTPSTFRPSRSVSDTPTPSTLRPSGSVGDTPTPSTFRPSRSVSDTPTPSTLRPSGSVGDTPTPSTLRPSRSVGDTPIQSSPSPSGSIYYTPPHSTSGNVFIHSDDRAPPRSWSSSSSGSDDSEVSEMLRTYRPGSHSCMYLSRYQRLLRRTTTTALQRAINSDVEHVREMARNDQHSCDYSGSLLSFSPCPVCRRLQTQNNPEHLHPNRRNSLPFDADYPPLRPPPFLNLLERTTDSTSQTLGDLNEPERADRGTDMVDLVRLDLPTAAGAGEGGLNGSGQSVLPGERDLERQLFENNDEISRIETNFLASMRRLTESRNRILSTLMDRGSEPASTTTTQPAGDAVTPAPHDNQHDSAASTSSTAAGPSAQSGVMESSGSTETGSGAGVEGSQPSASGEGEEMGTFHTLPTPSGSSSSQTIEVINRAGEQETITYSELARRMANREDVLVVGNHRRGPAAATTTTTSQQQQQSLASSGQGQQQSDILRSCLATSPNRPFLRSRPCPVPPPVPPPSSLPGTSSSSSTTARFPRPPRILVQRPSSEDQPQGSNQERSSPPLGMGMHNLHPHYARPLVDDMLYPPVHHQSINSAIAGVFLSSGEQAVASNIVSSTYRIQRWNMRQFQMPDLADQTVNMVVSNCKIHNDASVDLSRDSTLLATFVHIHGGFPEDNILAVFSLRSESLGQCLYTKSFGPNAISVSISPSNQYLMVGLASRRMLFYQVSDKQLMGQVFKMVKEGAGEDSMKHVTDVYHPVQRTSRLARGMSPVSVNSARWMPDIGDGLVYGTNHGDLNFFRSGRTRASVEEEERKPRKVTISTQMGSGSIRRSSFTQTVDEGGPTAYSVTD